MRRSIRIRGVQKSPIDLEKLAEAMVSAARAQLAAADERTRSDATEQPAAEKAS